MSEVLIQKEMYERDEGSSIVTVEVLPIIVYVGILYIKPI